MNVFFTYTGCSVESEDFIRFLQLTHAKPTEDICKADVIIAHFCGMCTESFKSIPQHMAVLQGIKKFCPEVSIYAGGCASEVIDLKKRYPFLDGTFHRHSMIEDLSRYFGYDVNTAEILPASYYNSISIQYGCLRNCGFCKKAYMDMSLHSKPIEQVVRDVSHAVSQGYHDIVLFAENSTEYGLDFSEHVRLLDLLKAVHQIEGVNSLYISALCIDELITNPELVEYIKNSAKITKVQIEIQSLIPEVRKNMNLTSSVEDVLTILSAFSNKHIITNIMLGYPGETDENFQQQLELIEKHGLYYIQVNSYDDTPMVYAHGLPQISKSTVNSRMTKMIQTLKKVRTKKAEEIMQLSKKNALTCMYTSENRLEIIGESAIVNVEKCHSLTSGQQVQVQITGVNHLFDMFDKDQTMSFRGKII